MKHQDLYNTAKSDLEAILNTGWDFRSTDSETTYQALYNMLLASALYKMNGWGFSSFGYSLRILDLDGHKVALTRDQRYSVWLEYQRAVRDINVLFAQTDYVLVPDSVMGDTDYDIKFYKKLEWTSVCDTRSCDGNSWLRKNNECLFPELLPENKQDLAGNPLDTYWLPPKEIRYFLWALFGMMMLGTFYSINMFFLGLVFLGLNVVINAVVAFGIMPDHIRARYFHGVRLHSADEPKKRSWLNWFFTEENVSDDTAS